MLTKYHKNKRFDHLAIYVCYGTRNKHKFRLGINVLHYLGRISCQFGKWLPEIQDHI